MKFVKQAAPERTLKICLDISASDIGVAVIGLSTCVEYYDHFKTDPKGDYSRLLDTADELVTSITHAFWNNAVMPYYENIEVYPEDVFIGKNGHGMITPIMMHGVLLTMLKAWSIGRGDSFFWNAINVNTWRSWLLREAGIKPVSRKTKDMKAATKNALIEHYGYIEADVANDNVADACGIALWVRENTKGESND